MKLEQPRIEACFSGSSQLVLQAFEKRNIKPLLVTQSLRDGDSFGPFAKREHLAHCISYSDVRTRNLELYYFRVAWDVFELLGTFSDSNGASIVQVI